MNDLRDIVEVYESNNTPEVNRLLQDGWILIAAGIAHTTDTFQSSGEPIYSSSLSFILGRPSTVEEAQS